MLSDRDCKVLGTPGETVTHWGISRVVTREGKEKLERLDWAEESGVHLREFPIGVLSVDEVRARWGAGTFKCHWLVVDEQAENPSDRRKSGGHGPAFTLDAEQPTRVAAPPREAAMPQIVAPAGGISPDGLLTLVTTMMSLADKRADSMIQAVTQIAAARPGGGGGDASLAAKIAGLEAKLEADAKQREIEQKHRDELAAKDREIERLRREKEEAEREAEKDSAPRIEPGSSVVTQLGYGLANAALQKPELVGALLERVGPMASALFGGGNAAQPPAASPPATSTAAPPNGVPAPKPMPPVVKVVPKPAPEPSGPPPVSSWVPMQGSAGANGAAAREEPGRAGPNGELVEAAG